MEVFWIIFIMIMIGLVCFMCKAGKRKPMFSAPVVVTTTTIPGPPPAGYPPQNSSIQGYPMPQPQPGYAPQPYPNQTIPSYPMPQPQPQLQQADFNPPSYDQVMRGGEAYQKQAPYNPNYTGQ